jgi:hypothetical protein
MERHPERPVAGDVVGPDGCRAASCRRRARFSRASSARTGSTERRVASRLSSRASMARWRMMPCRSCGLYVFVRSPMEEQACADQSLANHNGARVALSSSFELGTVNVSLVFAKGRTHDRIPSACAVASWESSSRPS